MSDAWYWGEWFAKIRIPEVAMDLLGHCTDIDPNLRPLTVFRALFAELCEDMQQLKRLFNTFQKFTDLLSLVRVVISAPTDVAIDLLSVEAFLLNLQRINSASSHAD